MASRLRACLFLAVLSFSAPTLANASPPSSGDVLREINRIRQEQNLSPLRNDETAALTAAHHARELADRRLLSHRGLDGRRVAERYRRQGGMGLKIGEILGAGASVDSIISAWMESPGHKKAILGDQWAAAGVGAVKLEEGRIVLVVVFSNSRWVLSHLHSDGLFVRLAGIIHRVGADGHVFRIVSGGKAYSPAEKREGANGAVSVVFDIPVPQQGKSELIMPLSLEVQRNGLWQRSDLFLLAPPGRTQDSWGIVDD